MTTKTRIIKMAENNTNADKETKEKILNALKGKFEVTKVERNDWDYGIGIGCDFIMRGRKGTFTYDLEGGEGGINECIFDEEDEDDFEIYDEINDWVSEEIEYTARVKWNDKEIV